MNNQSTQRLYLRLDRDCLFSYPLNKHLTLDYSTAEVQEFLRFILAEWNLTISDYFSQMEVVSSFFLLAVTGLGKTVGTPIYLLQKAMVAAITRANYQPALDCAPRVWVVVPTIAIASESVFGLNKKWQEFQTQYSPEYHPKKALYGGRSSSFKAHYHAPIQFITTGVLPLLASSQELRPNLDIVLIDEAHKTLTGSEQMELALSKLWLQGIEVNYMSATVGTQGLAKRLRTTIICADQERYPKYWHIAKQELEETVLEVIQNFHVNQNLTHPLFPPSSYAHQAEVLRGIETNDSRASGILVVVDSFNGDASDAVRLRKVIAPICRQNSIEVLGFASSIRDDDEKNKVHCEQFERVVAQNKPYVIITTNVIEMGITWSTLDVVVTKSTEIVNRQINGYTVPVKVPISSAALLQRGGRVGRKRPGIVIISAGQNPTGQLATLTDQDLNRQGLPIETLKYPLQILEPYSLAYELTKLGKTTPAEIKDAIKYSYFPSVDNSQELDYVATMTQPLVDLYQKLGLNDLKYREVLPFYERWVGDSMYPWLLTAGKILVDFREDKQERKLALEAYFTFAFLGFMSTVPTSRIVAKDAPDSEKYRLPFSDLLSVGWKNLPTYEYTLDQSVEFAEQFFAKYSLRYRQEKTASNALKDYVANKAEVQFYKFFVNLLDHLDKKDYEDAEFYSFFDEGITSDGVEQSDEFEVSRFLKSCFEAKYQRYNMYPYNKCIEAFKTIYAAIGTNFTIGYDVTSSGVRQYSLTYDYQGKTIHEAVDPALHFVDIDTTRSYWGILVPTTVEDQTQVILKMEHWFYVPPQTVTLK